MIPHWTDKQGDLRAWLTTNPRILLGSDFDGTLAPVVNHPGEAELSDAARISLEQLKLQQGMTVVVISGRAMEDVRRRVGVAEILYAGNHGLEMLAPDGTKVFAPGVADGAPRLREVLAQLEGPLARVNGVRIEDKLLTASIHYRLVHRSQHALVERIVREALGDARDLIIRQGKLTWEILPKSDWHKGTALMWFMTQCDVPRHATAFIGDDVTDFDAFDVLPDGWTFVVGDSSPPSARIRLRDPGDTVNLIEWMANVRGSRASI